MRPRPPSHRDEATPPLISALPRHARAVAPLLAKARARIGRQAAAGVAALLLAAATPVAFAGSGARAVDTAVHLTLDDHEIRAAGITTTAASKEKGDIELTFPGTVVIPPQQLRVVAAPANGMVESMFVAADESVKAGQPIARLRSPDLVEAQRQYLAAIADEALASDRLRRAQMLVEARAMPERELRVAQTQAVNAKSQLDERQQILRLMDLSEAEIEELRTTRKIIPAVTIHAPISGAVTMRHVSPGERVDAAAPIYTIAQLDPLWVNIQVPAARLAALDTGEAVLLPAYGALGRIIRVGRTIDAQTQSANAVAEIEPKGGSVRPGLIVSVVVTLAQASGPQWSVPSASVVRHSDRAWVFVRSKDGFVARPVQVIAQTSSRTSIRADLSPDDQIADRGLLALLAELAASDKD